MASDEIKFDEGNGESLAELENLAKLISPRVDEIKIDEEQITQVLDTALQSGKRLAKEVIIQLVFTLLSSQLKNTIDKSTNRQYTDVMEEKKYTETQLKKKVQDAKNDLIEAFAADKAGLPVEEFRELCERVSKKDFNAVSDDPAQKDWEIVTPEVEKRIDAEFKERFGV